MTHSDDLLFTPNCASLRKSHRHAANDQFNSEYHRLLRHLKQNTMQVYSRCLATYSESEHSCCPMLYIASRLCTSYPILTLSLLVSWLLASTQLSLPFPRSYLFRILLFRRTVFGTTVYFSEIFALLSSSAILIR